MPSIPCLEVHNLYPGYTASIGAVAATNVVAEGGRYLGMSRLNVSLPRPHSRHLLSRTFLIVPRRESITYIFIYLQSYCRLRHCRKRH